MIEFDFIVISCYGFDLGDNYKYFVLYRSSQISYTTLRGFVFIAFINILNAIKM